MIQRWVHISLQIETLHARFVGIQESRQQEVCTTKTMTFMVKQLEMRAHSPWLGVQRHLGDNTHFLP